MNVLILGSGGREHTFTYFINNSKLVDQLYIAPGNAGTSEIAKNVNINVTDFDSISNFIKENNIELLVVGPEQPLCDGLTDHLKQIEVLKNLLIIGPSKAGAILEGSKAFSKKFMKRYNIPTASYFEVGTNNYQTGADFIEEQNLPIVLKADGLAAGKGVLIIDNKEEAKEALQEMLKGQFGNASKTVVIEEFLDGIEFSVFVLTNGNQYKILPTAKDYKRIGEGDTGLNTGGMGAVSPAPLVNDKVMKDVQQQIIEPTLEGLKNEHIDYCGFIYFGLMQTDAGPKVIEYNVRLGDPETQVTLPRIKSDLVELLIACCKNELDQYNLEIDERYCSTVVCASEGYPQKYEKGKVIKGINEVKDAIVFQAGTKQQGENIVTNGGRVLSVTGFGKTLQEALSNSYKGIDRLCFDGIYFRKDIGYEFL